MSLDIKIFLRSLPGHHQMVYIRNKESTNKCTNKAKSCNLQLSENLPVHSIFCPIQETITCDIHCIELINTKCSRDH